MKKESIFLITLLAIVVFASCGSEAEKKTRLRLQEGNKIILTQEEFGTLMEYSKRQSYLGNIKIGESRVVSDEEVDGNEACEPLTLIDLIELYKIGKKRDWLIEHGFEVNYLWELFAENADMELDEVWDEHYIGYGKCYYNDAVRQRRVGLELSHKRNQMVKYQTTFKSNAEQIDSDLKSLGAKELSKGYYEYKGIPIEIKEYKNKPRLAYQITLKSTQSPEEDFTSEELESLNTLEISGKIVGVEANSILLVKAGQFTDSDSNIEIPVKDGKFHYKMKLDFPESVDLFLGKAKYEGGRNMPLFLENGKIELTIYAEEEFDKNIVVGGELNAQFKKYKQHHENKFNSITQPLQDRKRLLFKNDEYHSDKAKLLHTQLENAKSQDEKIVIYEALENLKEVNQHLSPKAAVIENELKPIYEEHIKFQQDYIENNPSIVSYSFFLRDLMYNKENMDINVAKNNLQILSKSNPNHPYNKLASNLTDAIDNIKVGRKYIDFSAPDLNGIKINLSDKIDGQIALIDLWATWCGPCIARSRTMVPLYDEYKDKGFTIIGVAGEYKNTDRLVNFLDKEKWPWLNLVEIDKQNSIWQKYNVDGGGGGIFLIDNNGLIIAKDPTAEEVRKILENRLSLKNTLHNIKG